MSDAGSELTTRYNQWMEAVKQKDLLTLEQIVAPGFVYAATGHGRLNRKQWMDTLPIYELHSFLFSSIQVAEYGEVAVAQVDYQQEASVSGQPRNGNFLITDVWVKSLAGWRVVARSSIYSAKDRQTSV